MIHVTDGHIFRSGTKIGYLQGNDVRDYEGKKLGFIEGDHVFNTDGRKIAWVENDYIRMANGNSIRLEDNREHVTGDGLSDAMRMGIRVLLGD